MDLSLRRGWSRYDPFFDRPLRLFDQNFGMGLSDDDITLPFSATTSTPYILNQVVPTRRMLNRQVSGVSEIRPEKDSFEMKLDVKQFSPEELTVKTSDNCIIVEGKHEEIADEHGYISRHFLRRYVLPEGVKLDQDKVKCDLSSDGVLIVSLPKQKPELEKGEKKIPINITGIPAIKTSGSTLNKSTPATTVDGSPVSPQATRNEPKTTMIDIQQA